MGWTIEKDAHRIIVTFSGHLTGDEGARSVNEFCMVLGSSATHVVWDVEAMSGYESAARRAWQERLKPLRSQIRSITLVGGSALMRMGASTIALFLGLRCEFVPTRAALPP